MTEGVTTFSTQKEKPARAVLLLRASSKKQTDQEHDFDIPQQRTILVPFIAQRGWDLIRTFTEGGVSGYKVSAADRDAIQDIKKMADRHEFDVLVIYMSDRLGRIADETPLIVSYLNKRGIKIVSYVEGEISSVSHTDKLMTYIRYWQAEGESLKTSQRVSDRIEQLVKEGVFRGGSCPYGYKMVNNGRNNYKGKPVLDITIDEEKATVVQKIYELAREQNYGSRKIAAYLNENGIKAKQGGAWGCGSVNQIMRHTLYKGTYFLKSKGIMSPPMTDLIIVPPDDWEATQKVVNKRSDRRRGIPNTTHGVMLLAGLMYCGYCGRKITSFQAKSKKKTVDGETVRTFVPKYRCSAYMYPKGIPCDGQSTYSARKVEEAVVSALKGYISTLSTQDLTATYLERVTEQIKTAKNDLSKKQAAVTRIRKELSALKEEVVKSLMGESKFDTDTLQELLSKKELEVREGDGQTKKLEKELDYLTESRDSIVSMDDTMQDWDAQFDLQDTAGQKAMLAQVVDRIDLFRDKVVISVNIKYGQYKDGLASQLKPDTYTLGDVNCYNQAA